MLIFEELPTAFPWYDKLEKQTRYKDHGDGVCDYKLIAPKNSLLPFQFRKISTKKIPVVWKIFEINTNIEVAEITAFLSQLKYKTLGDYDYFYYDGSTLGALDLGFGFYYSRLELSDGSFLYSEMFTVPEIPFSNSAATKYLKLVWYNSADLDPFYFNDQTGGIPYFQNVVYLDSFVNASEPQITEDGTKDGNDEVIPTFQKASIQYQITAMVPDYLKVALVLMQLHDKIILTEPGGIREGEIKKVSTNSSVESGGFLSVVDILFFQDLLIINRGCDNPIGPDTGATGWT